MSVPGVWPQVLDFFGTPLVIEPSPGQLSGDAGLLPVRQFDQHIGLTRSFAVALEDPRDPDLTKHTLLEMVRSRVYGILAGYEDQNDHDTLRVPSRLPFPILLADPLDSALRCLPQAGVRGRCGSGAGLRRRAVPDGHEAHGGQPCSPGFE
jgi:hypothetical protein